MAVGERPDAGDEQPDGRLRLEIAKLGDRELLDHEDAEVRAQRPVHDGGHGHEREPRSAGARDGRYGEPRGGGGGEDRGDHGQAAHESHSDRTG